MFDRGHRTIQRRFRRLTSVAAGRTRGATDNEKRGGSSATTKGRFEHARTILHPHRPANRRLRRKASGEPLTSPDSPRTRRQHNPEGRVQRSRRACVLLRYPTPVTPTGTLVSASENVEKDHAAMDGIPRNESCDEVAFRLAKRHRHIRRVEFSDRLVGPEYPKGVATSSCPRPPARKVSWSRIGAGSGSVAPHVHVHAHAEVECPLLLWVTVQRAAVTSATTSRASDAK